MVEIPATSSTPSAALREPRPTSSSRRPTSHKWFGRLQGAEGRLAHGQARRGRRHHRRLGLRQDDLHPLHQPPREDPGRPDLGERPPDRLPRARTASSSRTASGTSPASASEIGMVFQRFNLFPHMTALEQHHRGADARARHAAGRGGGRRPGAARAGRARGQGRRLSRRSSPAASSSASRSPGRWRCAPR